jgi:hypothetical protein
VETFFQNPSWWTSVPLWYLWIFIPPLIFSEKSQDYPHRRAPTCVSHM